MTKKTSAIYQALVDAFPGFKNDSDVNAADLISWVAANLALFKEFGLRKDLYRAFPGFKHGTDVNGAGLVDWISLNLEVFKVIQPVEKKPKPAPTLTPAQKVLLESFDGGEFKHLLELPTRKALYKALAESGNALLAYLFHDLGLAGTGGELEESVMALEHVERQISAVRTALHLAID